MNGIQISTWLHNVGQLCQSAITRSPSLRLVCLWIHERFLCEGKVTSSMNMLRQILRTEWTLQYSSCRATHFGDPIDTCRYIVSISATSQTLEYVTHTIPIGCQKCLDTNIVEPVTLKNLPSIAPTKHVIREDRAYPVCVVYRSNNHDLASYSASNLILGPNYPALEPAPAEYANNIFGCRFGVLLENTSTSTCARRLSNIELLRCYSIIAPRLPTSFMDNTYTSMLDSNIHYCVPARMKSKILSTLIDHVRFTDDITFGASETSDNLQCYHLAKSPTATDWTEAYSKDKDTATILHHLISDAKAPWSVSALSNVHQ